jgi:hypothetical protein
MNWPDALHSAIERYTQRHKSPHFSRKGLLWEELDTIKADTGTSGNTPEQTLSRTMQILRDQGVVEFVNNDGDYLYLSMSLNVEDQDLPDFVLDDAIRRNKLLIGTVPTSEKTALARRRRGQDRIRRLTLQNYGNQCAFCDITEENLLVTSHVVRWADDVEARGNLANLLCLCRFHDVLFENGYFSLTDELCVIKKANVPSEMVRQQLALTTGLRIAPTRPPAAAFLRRHRERVGLN